MRRSYDFSAGVRGKYAARFTLDTNSVELSPHVQKDFPMGNIMKPDDVLKMVKNELRTRGVEVEAGSDFNFSFSYRGKTGWFHLEQWSQRYLMVTPHRQGVMMEELMKGSLDDPPPMNFAT